MEYEETLVLQRIFQRLQGGKLETDQDLKDFMIRKWPKSLGAYSHRLPGSEEEETWESLLHVVKSIAPSTSVEDSKCQ